MAPRVFQVKSGWLADEGHRLNAGLFASGGIAIRDRIKAGPLPWAPLESVSYIFRGPLHKRIYVRDPNSGFQYLTASECALLEPPGDAFLSRKLTPEKDILRVEAGWTLVSSAGTIGNATYVRQELAGCLISQDMLRVTPRKERILSDYLFAFLAAGQARTMLKARTYGSVVDRIEPKHITDLPVPLAEAADQRRIHNLVEAAAAKRTEASRLLDEASAYLDAQAGPFRYPHEHALAAAVVTRSALRQRRLDALAHCGWSTEAASTRGDRLDSLAAVTRPGIIKRLFAERGIPFVSGIDVFQLRPLARTRLRPDEAQRSGAIIRAGQILVQRSGQRYGLLGRPAYVGRRLDGWASSEDLLRVSPEDASQVGRIFSFLRSEAGRRQLVGQSYGTSIPHINSEIMSRLVLPPLPHDLVDNANRALQLREEADADEERAVREVEAWLS
jgi:type I restriction enzyme, S subunit